jgi:hypothetical protein
VFVFVKNRRLSWSVVLSQSQQGSFMQTTKTLQQREKELQSLLADAEGQKELQELESQYYAVSGKPRAARASIITYILVHERERGLIVG